MFLERQKLNVRETAFDYVVSEQRRNLAISQWSIVFFRDSPPRSQMHFVDRKWFAPGLLFFSTAHPCAITKLVRRLEYDRRSLRRHLHHERVGIGFEKLAPAFLDLVLVKLARLEAR